MASVARNTRARREARRQPLSRVRGDRIVFEVAGGRYLRIAYSLNASSPRRCGLRVGGVERDPLRFMPTGSWSRYATLVVPLDLPVAGEVVSI